MKLLKINASLTPDDSASLKLSNIFVNALKQHTNINLIEADLSTNIKNIDANWIGAAFTPEESRTHEQQQLLSISNQFIEDLKNADEVILATPMYNFMVPANLKTYFDLISRVGVTFKYTEKGPIGLIGNKPITVIITTGGTEVGHSMDFMSQYIKQIFAFIGMTNITFVASDKRSSNADEAFEKANTQLNELAEKRGNT